MHIMNEGLIGLQMRISHICMPIKRESSHGGIRNMLLPESEMKSIGIQMDEILLPSADSDMTRWAVVACDQYTSEPEYWNRIGNFIGDAASTLHLIYPEVWLDQETESRKAERIAAINQAMEQYDADHFLQAHQGPILVERTTRSGRCRLGLMVSLDLERYDYLDGSQSLIRATEGTIVDRLPPRIRIRENARLELPHIMVLIDDPEKTVIEPLYAAAFPVQSPRIPENDSRAQMEIVYDFQLMENSGHLTGWKCNSEPLLTRMVNALARLADTRAFQSKYRFGPEYGVLLFAVGDGNHSLATAKSCWERLKKTVPQSDQATHPARYALVELVNVHDEGLFFEPIHRVLFGADLKEWLQAFTEWHQVRGIRTRIEPFASDALPQPEDPLHPAFPLPPEELPASGTPLPSGSQAALMIHQRGKQKLIWENPSCQLAVGSLQSFLDEWLANHPESILDYVHGNEAAERLGSKSGNIGFLLPPMGKEELFPTVIRDGALPRKTFSMGEAHEKRFYLECRRIR